VTGVCGPSELQHGIAAESSVFAQHGMDEPARHGAGIAAVATTAIARATKTRRGVMLSLEARSVPRPRSP